VADVYNKKKRSQIMAKIKGKNTSQEILLAAILKNLGFKFQKHIKDLPGCPDLVLSRQRIAIFANGCFWHAHKDCRRAALPTTNRNFWSEKIAGNRKRDERQKRLLRKMGWKVLTFWTCKPITFRTVTSRLRMVGVLLSRGDTSSYIAKANA
jgi:DNA mismatch endonuclease, patch repair protein